MRSIQGPRPSRARRWAARRVLLVAVTALAASPLAASPTQAATPITACSTIATGGRYVLTSDITCGSEFGISVVGSNVTIDLGGHTITGPGRTSGGSERAIDISTGSGSRYVKISNGTIRSFEWGVVAQNVQNLTVSGLRIYDTNYYGIYVERSNNVSIDSITFDGDSAGENNLLAEEGIYCSACADVTLSRSTLRDAKNRLVFFDRSTRVKISTTTVTHSSMKGVETLNTNAEISYVTARSSGDVGIRVDCEDSSNQGQMLTLTNSTAIDSGADGFELDDCGTAQSSPVIKGNRAEHNAGDGFDVDDMYYTTYDANVAVLNAGRGFYFQSARQGPSVKSNTATDNGDDGFSAEGNYGLSAFVDGSGNIALRNGGKGFNAPYAVPGTGNYASGNTGTPQCVGWACKRR